MPLSTVKANRSSRRIDLGPGRLQEYCTANRRSIFAMSGAHHSLLLSRARDLPRLTAPAYPLRRSTILLSHITPIRATSRSSRRWSTHDRATEDDTTGRMRVRPVRRLSRCRHSRDSSPVLSLLRRERPTSLCGR